MFDAIFKHLEGSVFEGYLGVLKLCFSGGERSSSLFRLFGLEEARLAALGRLDHFFFFTPLF